MTEKGLDARDTSVPNFNAKACCLFVNLNHAAVSSKLTS